MYVSVCMCDLFVSAWMTSKMPLMSKAHKQENVHMFAETRRYTQHTHSGENWNDNVS